MNATERLDQIEARVGAATPGPWVTRLAAQDEYPRDVLTAWSDDGRRGRFVICEHAGVDDDFIAASRQDVPALVTALRAVLAECDAAVTNQDGSWADADRIEAAVESALGGTQ